MAKKIFNENLGVDTPVLVLERRDFFKLGNIVNVSDIEYKSTLNTFELSFTVYKDKKDELWDKINNYNLIYIPEYNEHFSMHVNTNEENMTQKTVECTYLPVSELQEIKLRNIEINTEDDIKREDYDPDYPTIFYRDLTGYTKGSKIYKKLKNASLLHRILDKALNYKIGHVDTSLKDLKTWFQYSISDTNIYDELTGEISEDYQCLFTFDSATRTINVYDLCNTCYDCGFRGEFNDNCPECNSKNFGGAYGDDTTIFISKENLLTNASLESNKDNLKNCFYITGGDELMTSAVSLVNPSGSNYIMQFSEEMYENMPSNLVEKLKEYNNSYMNYLNTYSYNISDTIILKYNDVISYINTYYPNYDLTDNRIDRFKPISSPIIGYKNISSLCFDCIDANLILQSSMGKTIKMDNPSIQETMNLLYSLNSSSIAVKSNVSQVSEQVVTNTVSNVCKTIINTSLYKCDILDASYSTTSHKWTGKFKLTNIEDNDINLIGNNISITVNNDMETYLRQNIQRTLNKLNTNYKDLRKLDLSNEDFISELKYYSFDYLSGLKDAYSEVLSVILASEIEDLKEKYNKWYMDRISFIENEMNKRQGQINIIKELYDFNTQNGEIYIIQNNLRNQLDIEVFLGEDLWKIFCSYRMEDTYQNDNFISDGLDNFQLVSRANELIELAKKELYQASHVQYTITSTMNNLLALKEFQPIVDKFETGNWIRVCIDEKIYHLRLLSYKIFFDDVSKIEVEFSTVSKTWSGSSDIDSVLQSAQSIASSYSYTAQKIKNNTNSSKYVTNWVEKGLDATTTKIVNNADNQNIVYDSSGILCRTYDDLSGEYDLCQSRQINSGLYVTDDGWNSIKAAIGKYIYINPITNEEIETMGVIASTIVGKFILGEKLGIYNSGGTLEFTEDGLSIINNNGYLLFTRDGLKISNNENNSVKNTFAVDPNNSENFLKISRKDNDGSENNVFWTDNQGNLHMVGIMDTTGGYIRGNLVCEGTITGGTITGGTITGRSEININNRFTVNQDGFMCIYGDDGKSVFSIRLDDGYVMARGGINCSDISIAGLEIYRGISSYSMLVPNSKRTIELITDDGEKGIIKCYIDGCCSTLANGGDFNSPMTFQWNGQAGQPTWVWGGEDGTNMYVYNPANFSVNYANSADYANGAHRGLDPNRRVYTGVGDYERNFSFSLWSNLDGHAIDYGATLGRANARWNDIYCASSTINTSDKNLKDNIKSLTDTHLKFFSLLQPVSFTFKDGTSGRTHVGFISQDVEEAMKEVGLSNLDFAGFCKDVKMNSVMDDDGKITDTQVLDENGKEQYIYSLRYEEFIALNTYAIQHLTTELNETKKELSDLKETVNKLINFANYKEGST